MGNILKDPHEIAEIGRRIYETKFQSWMEKKELGRFIIINIDNSDYLLADTHLEALDRFHARYPGAPSWSTKIGESLSV